MNSPALSVVIPAHNEEEVLSAHLAVLVPLLSSLCGSSWEIIVVDDGSTDRTAEVALACGYAGVRLVSLAANQGKGAALCAGMRETRGERVLMCDADMSTSPDHLLEFWTKMDSGADIVIGNRRSAQSKIVRQQAFLRRNLGKVYIAFATVLLGVAVRDVNCGFKLFRGEIARELFGAAETSRWAIDIEILARAAKKNYHVTEVPVVWCDADKSNVKILRDAWQTFWQVLRIACRVR